MTVKAGANEVTEVLIIAHSPVLQHRLQRDGITTSDRVPGACRARDNVGAAFQFFPCLRIRSYLSILCRPLRLYAGALLPLRFRLSLFHLLNDGRRIQRGRNRTAFHVLPRQTVEAWMGREECALYTSLPRPAAVLACLLATDTAAQRKVKGRYLIIFKPGRCGRHRAYAHGLHGAASGFL